jgi:hypothetical protein
VIPHVWTFFLLAAAAYRIYRLISEDTILDRPRAWLLGLPSDFDPEVEDAEDFPNYSPKVATFITCPWCLGAHLSLVWYLLWVVWPTPTLVVATPLALSAVIALVATRIQN